MPAHSSPSVETEPISRGTGNSNPSPSSGESANPRYREFTRDGWPDRPRATAPCCAGLPTAGSRRHHTQETGANCASAAIDVAILPVDLFPRSQQLCHRIDRQHWEHSEIMDPAISKPHEALAHWQAMKGDRPRAPGRGDRRGIGGLAAAVLHRHLTGPDDGWFEALPSRSESATNRTGD